MPALLERWDLAMAETRFTRYVKCRVDLLDDRVIVQDRSGRQIIAVTAERTEDPQGFFAYDGPEGYVRVRKLGGCACGGMREEAIV